MTARVRFDARGATVAELLAAATVIAVGAVALLAVLPVASHAVHDGAHRSTAVFLAAQRLEQVRSARWEAGAVPVDEVGVSTSPSSAPAALGVTTFPDEATMAAPFAEYARRVRVLDCAAGAGCGGVAHPELRQVVVEVDYRPLAGTGAAPAAQRGGVRLSLFLSRR
jgi:hypothetical protein